MAQEKIQELKRDMIAIGRLLWEKDLVSGLNGNISMRIDGDSLLLTAHNTCLGICQEDEILALKLNGTLLEEGDVSTEKLLHTEIYNNFPQIKAVIHTHTTHTNAYFLENEIFQPRIFEAKFYLGEVHSVFQGTPSVTDVSPVIEALKNNNIVVLRNHGVVAMGEDLFDCFLLIQALEEAVKTEVLSRLFRNDGMKKYVSARVGGASRRKGKIKTKRAKISLPAKKFRLFSKEHMDNIVKLVNADSQMAGIGSKTKMNMDLAVKLNETGQTYSFRFENGKITKVGHDENAEFLVSAPASVWRAVFNREIDPFVATTQKKMHLRGDFAKISKWYAPCSRVFELWQQVPVE